MTKEELLRALETSALVPPGAEIKVVHRHGAPMDIIHFDYDPRLRSINLHVDR